MLDLYLADSRNLYFCYVLESIHKFITDLHVLQCLFVRGSNKKQRRGRIISNFTKRIDFFISYDDQVLLEVISQCGPLLAPFKKDLLLPFRLTKKSIYLDTQFKPELPDLFWDRMFPILTSRNRIINTFMKVNITPTCKRQFIAQVSAFPFQKSIPSPFSLAKNRIYLGTHLKKELTSLFWKLPGYSLFPHRQSRQ